MAVVSRDIPATYEVFTRFEEEGLDFSINDDTDLEIVEEEEEAMSKASSELVGFFTMADLLEHIFHR